MPQPMMPMPNQNMMPMQAMPFTPNNMPMPQNQEPEVKPQPKSWGDVMNLAEQNEQKKQEKQKQNQQQNQYGGEDDYYDQEDYSNNQPQLPPGLDQGMLTNMLQQLTMNPQGLQGMLGANDPNAATVMQNIQSLAMQMGAMPGQQN